MNHNHYHNSHQHGHQYQYNQYNQSHQQSMLDKQKVEQLVDTEYNIDFMGRALSKAEIYAFRFGDQKIIEKCEPKFGFYNRFNSGYEREKEELFKSLINAVKFVEYAFEETEEEYGKIIFPNNMSEDEVIKYIESLSSCIKDIKEKEIYNDLIKVLKRVKSDLNKYNHLYDKNAKMDPKKMMKVYPDINKAIEKKEKNWRKKIENDPNYKPEIIIGQKFEQDPDFKECNEKIQTDNK